MTRIAAGTYPFSHHNIYIPEHLKIMLDGEVAKNKNYNTVNQWLRTKYTGDWNVQTIKQVLSGRTKSPSVDLLEDVRRLVTKTGVASQYSFPQLPIIRLSEVQRIVAEDSGLRYNYIAEKIDSNSPTISNIVNGTVQYRYDIAWKFTHFFIGYFENPSKHRVETTWDFYGWIKDRRAQEGIMTPEEHAKWRDSYNRRTGGNSTYVKKN
jgi:transcriptional regulator with XRE-family HTH domain